MQPIAILTAIFLAGFPFLPTARGAEARTIGILCHCRSDFPTLSAFEAGLSKLNLRDGENVRIIRFISDGDPARLARQAKEIVQLKPDVIFAGFTPAVIALKEHTKTIPVVFAGVSEAAEIGASSELARPDRNFTGPITINRELMPKRLELLKQAVPTLSAIGYLANPSYGLHQPQLKDMEQASQRMGVRLVVAEVSKSEGIEAAFEYLKGYGAQALVVQQDPLFTGQPQRIVSLAERHKLPDIYPLRSYFKAGALMSYGADVDQIFEHAADYVSRILDGTKPQDLPIERPSKLHFGLNMKRAEHLGLVIDPALAASADEFIE